jgi:hypothetical protein
MLAEGDVGGSDERMVPDAGDAVQRITPARLDAAMCGVTLRGLVGGKPPRRGHEQGSYCLQRLAGV